ncbi:urea-proton symporter-like [Raphidocelis subcapitata]|uniref:Urea-proton symporter-like n=1 Tax=Raphidocelis subcapitata TaxID=307507 RepID=A0A2V0PHE3_9CHLO|nr:urea-proton symporter-like [Raphidocelis subcapitata]|eukprot:GBF99241.1 urea-proton symporter-like [Raphidocelis subcapitata]
MATAECYKWWDILGHDSPNFAPGQCSFFQGKHALSEALGWVIVVAFGALFTLLTSVLVYLDYRYGGTSHTSEQFSTAGRSVKAGLTACDIVSKWTWAATLLQSANVAYKYGVSGPFWYAAGATIQVLLFAVLAVEIKRKAPTTHTVLEIVKARWGTGPHIVFLVFCLLTNIIVTSMLILGGASVVNALTGVNIYAGAFLIPIGVMLYTAHGGLKATYIAAWGHVAVIYIALVIFAFMIYAAPSSPVGLGSIDKVYHNLMRMAEYRPVSGNKEGSFITMLSLDGLIFGIINIIGNFGTVFVDQAYWQGAIAAKPSATYKGYLLGGLCWFAIPFTMATSMGLGARAMNLPITIAESNAGLVPPAVATMLLGAGGAFLLVFQLWMAVTASGSAEQIAVSSLIAYDVYKPYINPKANGRQMIFVSRAVVIAYGILSGVFAILLLKIGLSLGWVYLFMGVCVGSAVVPIAFSITWAKCSGKAAVTGAIGGLIGAVIAWMCTAKGLSGKITIDTLGSDYAMLAGNLVAICLSGIICVVMSYMSPQNYNWAEMRDIPLVEDDPAAFASDGEDSPEALTRALRWTWLTGGALTLVLVVLWPLLSLPAGVFNKGYFTMWIIIALIWGLIASAVCIFTPIWESRQHIAKIFNHLVACSPAETNKEAFADTAKAVLPPGAADAAAAH